jgi:predicted N-acetyltransferase YhbS
MDFCEVNAAFDINGLGAAHELPISPLEGEMAGRPEGGASRCLDRPPSVGFADISPSRGEIAAALAITAEQACDVVDREALLDRAMGPGRRRKSSEKLRRGRRPSEGLALVAKDADGVLVGTVRLWDVRLGEGGRALLLGPLAVDPSAKSLGIGSALMRHAIEEARRLGHGAILLVGDAPYYARFGFSAAKTGDLAMPGPYERHRFLALEIVSGALDGAAGVLRAAGRKVAATSPLLAA